MNLNLQNKHVVISGGAKGIGAVAARFFRKEGAVPIILDLDKDAGTRLVEELGCGKFIEIDLRDEQGCKYAIDSAIVRRLLVNGQSEDKILTRTHGELDLIDQGAVRAFFEAERPDQVYLAAARVGGILANDTYPAEFIYENLMIAANVIHGAFLSGVKKLLFLGSNCIYPKFAPQPIPEDALLTGALEPTNEPYAIAKIAGIKLCESYNRQYGQYGKKGHGIDYRAVMPCNLYGPGDNYDPESAHVIAGLIRRFHEAKAANAPSVTVWGTGAPRRECLHVDDMAAACVHVMNLPVAVWRQYTQPGQGYVNVGYGSDVTIAELARLIARTVGYGGRIVFDPDKPDGTPKKLMDNSCLNALGWRPEVTLEKGLADAYEDFLKNQNRQDAMAEESR
uniref:GDP-L-fucose synthase n=1 Tax=Candidatus Kentrum sp. LPFa TaxID=2126335 RepID=A0A450VUN6_9GAMM|nr:MAG: GDP-L-fucose synthase [Candidatus Kentron sp. LPFa]VFK24718.1 MAG: GDP-L-fucose synthase [Candidatus Kentron sp. LPFa]